MEPAIDEHEHIIEIVIPNKQTTNSYSYIEKIWKWMNDFVNNLYIYCNDLITLSKEFYEYCEGDKLIKVD